MEGSGSQSLPMKGRVVVRPEFQPEFIARVRPEWKRAAPDQYKFSTKGDRFEISK